MIDHDQFLIIMALLSFASLGAIVLACKVTR